jgi:hypothetical protein
MENEHNVTANPAKVVIQSVALRVPSADVGQVARAHGVEWSDRPDGYSAPRLRRNSAEERRDLAHLSELEDRAL